MIPFFLLQFFSDAVLRGLGVDAAIAVKIVIYTRLMCVTSWLLLLEIHLENIFINLGYAKCATFNSLITGVGIDVACSYWFIYRFEWGVAGAAYAQITVKTSRILVWMALMCYFRLWNTICFTST